MDMLNEILETMKNPAMKHAAFVHLPVALSIIGVPFALATAIFVKSKAMRWTAIGVFLAFAAIAWLTLDTGQDAENQMPHNLPAQVYDIVQEHSELAEKIWILALATGALVALSAIPKPVFRIGGAWLGVGAAIFTAGWVAWTAHYGGEAVYTYGVGTAHPMIIDGPSLGPGERETASEGASARVPIDTTGLDEQQVYFVNNVQPILENVCQRCHNPRRARRSGGLDQTSIEAILAGGRNGPAIAPGHPDESLMIKLVTSDDPDTRMPPKEPLKPEEVEALRKWIADGAAWVARPEDAPGQ